MTRVTNQIKSTRKVAWSIYLGPHRGTFGICATYHIRVFAHHSQVHYLSRWCSLLQTSSILYSTTVVTRDTFPVFSVTSGAATHTITATAFYACFRNRCSEPRVSPASMCVPRVGFAPLCVLPPPLPYHQGFPITLTTLTLATLYCPHRDAPPALATLYCPHCECTNRFPPMGNTTAAIVITTGFLSWETPP